MRIGRCVCVQEGYPPCIVYLDFEQVGFVYRVHLQDVSGWKENAHKTYRFCNLQQGLELVRASLADNPELVPAYVALEDVGPVMEAFLSDRKKAVTIH